MGRFKSLVGSEEGMENFKTKYRIPPGVGTRYCKEGQWHTGAMAREWARGRSINPNDCLHGRRDENPYGYTPETTLGPIG